MRTASAGEVALGPMFDITWEPRGAQFALTLGEFYCRRLDAPILLEIRRDGVVFARVYDIRGRNFPTLLDAFPRRSRSITPLRCVVRSPAQIARRARRSSSTARWCYRR